MRPSRFVCHVLVFGSLLLFAARAAEEAKKAYDLPAGDAAGALKQFSEVSGRETLFAADVVRGVRTAPVKGEFTAKEALDQMLAATGLTAVQDERTGALAVKRVTDPNVPRAALEKSSDRPGENPRSDAMGGIRGQVSNAVTGANLGNVSIKVRGSSREYYTERDGSFLISNLAPGSYALSFEYPGLDGKTEQAVVGESQLVRLNVSLNSDVYVMPQLVVAGQREGNAAAIAEQRLAPNIENVITADAFGDITKANVGNLLRRIPGVTGITDDEIDTSVIQVRGMDASLTSIDIDGTRAASALNGSRKQNVNALPADIIEKVEVVKAPTAEDDADSLGGRVKLTTKSALDLNERLINLRVGGSYNVTYRDTVTEDRKNYLPASVGFTYADVIGFLGKPKSLGIMATVNYDRFLDARSITNFNLVNSTGGSLALGQKDYAVFNLTSDELHEQERKGGSLRFDYKAGEQTRLGLSANFTRYVDDFNRSRNLVNGGTVDTALSDPDPLFTVVNNSAYSATKNLRLSTTDTWTVRAFGSTQLAGTKITGDVVRTQADKFEFRNQTQFISNRKFSYALDRRTDAAYPHVVLRSGLDPFTDQFADTASTALEVRRQAVDKDIWGSRLDATKQIEWHWPVTLQGGMRFRSETQVEDQDRFVAAVATGVGKNLSAFLDPDWKNGGAVGRYPVGATPSNEKVLGAVKFIGGSDPRTAWSYDPNLLTVNASSTVQNSFLSDSTLEEDVYAGYLQSSVKFGALTVLGGARYERTDVFVHAGVRNRAVTDLLAQFNGQARSSSSYDDIFPTAHLRYAISDALLVRASFSTTIGRPDKGTVTTSDDLNVAAKAITVNSPDLLPEYSDNYDASLEYYFKPLGVISVGVFQKNIRNYISTVSTTISAAQAAELGAPLTNPSASDLSWTLTANDNTGTARVTGLEFNYSQQLSFLPGALRGLGVFLNYTTLNSTGTRQIQGGGLTVTPLTNFVPRSGNCGISYTYGRWDARVQLNHQSSFQDGFNAANPAGRNSFKGKRDQMDLNARCKLTRKLSVFANISNFTSENLADYQGTTAAAHRTETDSYSFIVTAGVNATF